MNLTISMIITVIPSGLKIESSSNSNGFVISSHRGMRMVGLLVITNESLFGILLIKITSTSTSCFCSFNSSVLFVSEKIEIYSSIYSTSFDFLTISLPLLFRWVNEIIENLVLTDYLNPQAQINQNKHTCSDLQYSF